MTVEQKIDRYRKEISDQAGVDNKAERLAEIDTLLEPHQGKMLVRLEFNEHSSREHIVFGVTDEGDVFSGNLLYSAGTRVVTGVFRGIGYQHGDINLVSGDLHEWDALYLYNGPKVERWLNPLSLGVQVVQAKDEKDDVLIWNGNLPVAYTEGFGFGFESSFSHGEQYAPRLLPREGLDSVAVVMGNEAAAGLFGLEGAEGITDTKSLYQAVLAQEGMDPKILSRWSPDEMKLGDHGQRANLFRPLEERIKKMPRTFFEEGIFTRYGIERPKDYNMTWDQKMSELRAKVEQVKAEVEQAEGEAIK